MKLLENSNKISEIESRLTKHIFLSKNTLPGYLDGLIFQKLQNAQRYPDVKNNPHFYHWYILMRQFAAPTIAKWVQLRLYYDSNDLSLERFLEDPSPKKSQLSQTISTQDSDINSRIFAPLCCDQSQIEYIIHILLKEYSEDIMKSLKKSLDRFGQTQNLVRVQLINTPNSKEVKIVCKRESYRNREIMDILSRNLEYESLQIKKYRKSKNTYREMSKKQ